MRWLQGAENMKEQPKTTEEKKKIKQGFCSLRSPVYAQISERQDLSLCLSCFPFFLSASHKDKKLVFCVVFYLFIAAGCLTNHQGSMCRVMLSIHTDTYIHTHLYVNSSTLYGFIPSLRRTLHTFVQHAHLRTLVQTSALHNEPLDHTSGKL